MAKKPPKRPSVGDIVHVVFLDHAENSQDVLLFEVIGRLSAITKKGYTVRCWGYVKDLDRAGDQNVENETSYAIVKAAVESIVVLHA